MLAFRLVQAQQPPELQDIAQPIPGPGQLLLRIGGCGLCHTDLGTVRQRSAAEWADRNPPFTTGHEIAGWIEEIGSGVVGFKTGEPVAVIPIWESCGHCSSCRRGEENFCFHITRMMGAGVGYDGGLADYMVVEGRYVVPIGDLDPVLAAPLTDAGLTTYTALKPALSMLLPGTTAVVIGAGGLGILAVQLLRALSSACVIAVDQNAKHLETAKVFGADHVLSSDANTASEIRELTSGVGATFVLDCVGVEATMRLGISALSRLGRFTLVGAARQSVPFGLHEIPWGAQLTTSLNGGTTNLREIIELTRMLRIETLVDRYPLSRVEDAYSDLEAGRLKGRAVCIPGG